MSTKTQGGEDCQNRMKTVQMRKVICIFKTKSLWLIIYSLLSQNFCHVYSSAEEDTEWQQSSDLQDFLLQSSDEEDVCSLELSDPQLDLEADVMAYFDKSPINNSRRLRENSSKYSTLLPLSVIAVFCSNQSSLHLKMVVSQLHIVVHFVPAVCQCRATRQHQEKKTEQKSHLITSLNIWVGKPG